MRVGILEHLQTILPERSRAESVPVIVSRCQEGDPVAFRLLFERYAPGVARHLQLLVGPGAEIDDLLQLVFVNVFQSIRKFRGDAAFSTWLFRVTINVARQEIRGRARRRHHEHPADDATPKALAPSRSSPEVDLATREQIYEILSRLSDKKRETFVLYVYQGYSLEEIAELYDTSISTVGSRLQSARREIQAFVKGRLR